MRVEEGNPNRRGVEANLEGDEDIHRKVAGENCSEFDNWDTLN